MIFFAALGLPGLCGFVGEFMVVLSTWNFSTPDYPNAGKVFAVLAALTVVITAAYILWTLQRVYFGTNPAYKDYKDMTLRELAVHHSAGDPGGGAGHLPDAGLAMDGAARDRPGRFAGAGEDVIISPSR